MHAPTDTDQVRVSTRYSVHDNQNYRSADFAALFHNILVCVHAPIDTKQGLVSTHQGVASFLEALRSSSELRHRWVQSNNGLCVSTTLRINPAREP